MCISVVAPAARAYCPVGYRHCMWLTWEQDQLCSSDTLTPGLMCLMQSLHRRRRQMLGQSQEHAPLKGGALYDSASRTHTCQYPAQPHRCRAAAARRTRSRASTASHRCCSLRRGRHCPSACTCPRNSTAASKLFAQQMSAGRKSNGRTVQLTAGVHFDQAAGLQLLRVSSISIGSR